MIVLSKSQLLLLYATVLIVGLSAAAFAEEWIVEGSDPAHIFTFTLSNGVLGLNHSSYSWGSHSNLDGWYDYTEDLRLSGDWAVCGSVDAGGVLHRDPYATFIYDGYGSGHVQWAADRPEGYTCTLLLGYAFAGESALTYGGYLIPAGAEPIYFAPVTGTVVLDSWTNYSGPFAPYYERSYSRARHAFAVPEPTCLAWLLSGIGGMGMLLRRSRR